MNNVLENYSGVFSGLAVIIACVGLFGLSAYTASLRTKEIGIRKVLGASVAGVVLLLSKEFTKLVIIAFPAGCPTVVVDDGTVAEWICVSHCNGCRCIRNGRSPGAGDCLVNSELSIY